MDIRPGKFSGFEYALSFFILGLILIPVFSFGQNNPSQSPSNSKEISRDSSTNKVNIDSTKILRFVDGVKQLVGNVSLRQGDARMFCDSASIIDNNVNAYGNVIIRQKDSVFVFADTLVYIGNTRKATLFGKVKLTDSVQTLSTNKLDYDLNTRIGTYNTGATLINEQRGTKLSSKRGYYYVREKEAYFAENVSVVDSNYTLQADTLEVDTETNITYFHGPTNVQTKENKIYCEAGFYDTNNNYAEFLKNARLVNEDQTVEGDRIRYDGDLDQAFIDGRSIVVSKDRTIESVNAFYDRKAKVTRFSDQVVVRDSSQTLFTDSLDYYSEEDRSEARGNVYLVDEKENLTVRSDYATYYNNTGYLKASGRPLVSNLIDQDTIWLAADTLFSFKVDSLNARILIAQNDVRVFKSDLQSVCDSLVYSTVDSSFRFFRDPIMWSDSSQFFSDTITVFLKDNQIDHIDLDKNAFIINTSDELFYNQIKGRDIVAYFEDDELRRMDVRGNGESVYYLLDEEKYYVGVNKTVCSEMLVEFGNNEVQAIHFYTSPQANLQPMRKADHRNLRLAGFKWLIKRKPLSKDDLR